MSGCFVLGNGDYVTPGVWQSLSCLCTPHTWRLPKGECIPWTAVSKGSREIILPCIWVPVSSQHLVLVLIMHQDVERLGAAVKMMKENQPCSERPSELDLFCLTKKVLGYLDHIYFPAEDSATSQTEF